MKILGIAKSEKVVNLYIQRQLFRKSGKLDLIRVIHEVKSKKYFFF